MCKFTSKFKSSFFVACLTTCALEKSNMWEKYNSRIEKEKERRGERKYWKEETKERTNGDWEKCVALYGIALHCTRGEGGGEEKDIVPKVFSSPATLSPLHVFHFLSYALLSPSYWYRRPILTCYSATWLYFHVTSHTPTQSAGWYKDGRTGPSVKIFNRNATRLHNNNNNRNNNENAINPFDYGLVF